SLGQAMPDSVSNAPAALRSRACGNPMATGLIAFGVGWLVGSLLPASSAETRVAAKAKESAAPLTDKLTDAAKEVGEHLREPAQQAVESVKGTAADAAQTVKEEGQSSAQDVGQQAREAKETVQESRQ
ncbi:MAG: hypothetical protein M3159_07830, partial [Actinomycetota bacterium]|nr:hypothetical protein [Actinomycetota bacterium]